jgi:hypothetical protein
MERFTIGGFRNATYIPLIIRSGVQGAQQQEHETACWRVDLYTYMTANYHFSTEREERGRTGKTPYLDNAGGVRPVTSVARGGSQQTQARTQALCCRV